MPRPWRVGVPAEESADGKKSTERPLNIQSFVRRILPALIILVGGFCHRRPGHCRRARPVKVSIAAISTANQQQLINEEAGREGQIDGQGLCRLTATKWWQGRRFKATTVKFSRKGEQDRETRPHLIRKDRALQMWSEDRDDGRQLSPQRSAESRKQAKSSKKKTLAKWAANENCIEYASVELGDDPEHCDFMDTTVCLQPWPNDYYMKDDASTPTGKRLDIAPGATPRTPTGPILRSPTSIAVTASAPGSLIVLKVPGLDTPLPSQQRFRPLSDLHAYDDPPQRVVLIDAATGERSRSGPNSTQTRPRPIRAGTTRQNQHESFQHHTGQPDRPTGPEPRVGPLLHRRLPPSGRQRQPDPVAARFRVYRDELPTRQAIVEARRDP